nr:TIGR02186 family protein [Acuticoccus mangrovi]
MSADVVRVASNFSGARLSLFGVIERDAQTVARAGTYEVIVVVRGPPQDVLVQRKERRFGIWMNSPGERFSEMPSYYGVFASPGAEALFQDPTAPGLPRSLSTLAGGNAERQLLARAMTLHFAGDGLFVERFDAVSMLTKTFFRTDIPLPSVVADGDYSVTIFLYADGAQLDTEELAFTVSKVGFEQRMFELSRHQPLLYGIGAVVIALLTGYVGGVVFRRN